MASISTDSKTGLKRLVFTGLDSKRRSIHLGKVSDRTAQTMSRCVEGLLDAALAGQAPSPQTTAIVESLSPLMEGKLVKAELIHPREESQPRAVPTVVEFVDSYIAKRTDTKPATLIVYKRCRTLLAAYFPSWQIDEITTADAKDFCRWMRTRPKKPLAENTARRMTGFARQFFNDAVERELLTKNPFLARDIKVAVRGNAERFYFVSRDDAAKVLEACPDAQ